MEETFMSFYDIDVSDKYRSDDCKDIGSTFVSKVLEESVIYKRAVGFFSSSSLIKLSKGICCMLEKENPHIYFVVSPVLYKEDVEAIKNGYRKRKEVIEDALLREFEDVTDEFGCERLNLLSHLIELNILDIKVADTVGDLDEDDFGIFHEKIGVFIDADGNKIAFSGSLNESDTAFSRNFESIQVFKSWEESKRVIGIEDDFDRLWDDRTNHLEIYDFPEAVKQKLFKYHKPIFRKDIDAYELIQKEIVGNNDSMPHYKCPFDLYDYQKQAINNWAKQGLKGLFDMGTGTGKTVTALTASVKLLERLKYKLAVIVVCPYKHLVEQWVQEETNFNIRFIVGYSDSKYKDYRSVLRKTIQDFNDGIINYFYFITTNASFRSDGLQEILDKIDGDILLIADEVHNFGADGIKSILSDRYKYRIGLSATVDRHNDDDGTSFLYDYFGEPVIHYGLKEAILNNVLTRYYYYPIVVTLTEEEKEKYIELTNKLKKCTFKNKVGKTQLTKEGERIAIERARVIATAENKIDELRKTIEKYRDEHNILVYCGTGKVNDSATNMQVRQIDEVCRMLGNDLKMKIARYTAQENMAEREMIRDRYKDGDDLQAVVAIKCLDEGVNIPSIKMAFILASSTNPREYIQRRGRVLRKFKGKTYSYIYDFVTLPFDLNDGVRLDDENSSLYRSLAQNEINRIKEFSSLCENCQDSDIIITRIIEKYNLDKFETTDTEYEKIDWEDIDYGD